MLSINFGFQGDVFGEPEVKQTAKGVVTEVSHLEGDPGQCLPDVFSGRIVKRNFDEKTGISLTGITLEFHDGTREFINVKIPDDLNMALFGTVAQGLQILSKVGREMKGSGFRCGAAGRFLILDSIK